MRLSIFLIIGLMVAAIMVLSLDNPRDTFAAPLPTPTAIRKPFESARFAPTGSFGPVTKVNTDTARFHNETSIAIDPTNVNRILATSRVWAPEDYVFYYLSADGGATWSQGKASTGDIRNGDPWVTFDKNGNGYLIETSRTPYGIYLSRLSPSNVWSFDHPVTITVSGFNDKPFVAVDPTNGPFANRIYTTWTWDNFTGTRLIYSSYIDAGSFPTSTFSSQVLVNAPFATNTQWSYIAVGADGAVYVAYLYFGATDQILLAKSTNGGVSFTNTYTMAIANGDNLEETDQIIGSPTGIVPVNHGPVLVTHPTLANKLAAIWMDGYNCSSPTQCLNAHIVASHSNDGGVSWSSPVVVNDDSDAGKRDHFLPALAVDSNGVLHASWYDRRQALNCTNPYFYNVVYSSSSDWGQTWSRNARISSAASDPSNPNFGAEISGGPNYFFVGDYSSIAVSNDGSVVIPFWTDTTTGVQNVAIARATTPVNSLITNSCSYIPLIKK